MNAKQARAYANQQLAQLSEQNRLILSQIMSSIKKAIDEDPTKTYVTVAIPPKQVIASLEGPEYGYETAIVTAGPNESELKISWAEGGIKQYGNATDYYNK